MTRFGIAILLASILAACNSEAPPAESYPDKMAAAHQHDTPSASPATLPPPASPIASQTVQYATVNGKPVQGYLAYPSAAEGGLPGVLVFHEWWGLNDNIRAMANQLAGEGYVALAVDVYGGRAATDPDAARALMEQAMKDGDGVRQNLRQAHAYLKDQVKATRIGTIGWCFGGGLSLQAALLVPDQVDAAIVYYGHVSSDPAELRALKAPLLGLFGGADQGIPPEDVHKFEAALKALGKDAEIHIYDGAGHAFANPSGKNYQPEAAADAWKRSLAFLAAHLKGD
jgi:carboxymethylenebutenolidase